MNVCFSLNLLFHILGCVFISSLSFFPSLPCLLPWFILSASSKRYVKEKKKKSDIYKVLQDCPSIIFGGIKKAFRHCLRCSELKPFISGMEGSHPANKLFQDQTQNISHFAQLTPFTVTVYSSPRISKVFYFLSLWEWWFSQGKKIIQTLAMFFQAGQYKGIVSLIYIFSDSWKVLLNQEGAL